MTHTNVYKLGPWIISPNQNSISNGAEITTIDNKCMQVLLLLIEQGDTPVTKQQFFDHVWKGKVVTDDILSVAISNIRKVLGDSPQKPTYIKTLSGVGYVLVAPVKTVKTVGIKNQTFSRQIYLLTGTLILILFFAFIYFEIYIRWTAQARNRTL